MYEAMRRKRRLLLALVVVLGVSLTSLFVQGELNQPSEPIRLKGTVDSGRRLNTLNKREKYPKWSNFDDDNYEFSNKHQFDSDFDQRETAGLPRWQDEHSRRRKERRRGIQKKSTKKSRQRTTTTTAISHPGLNLREKIVHFDLKGAPPRVSYYQELFPFLRKAGVTGVMLEYEDMFPFEGMLSVVKNGNAYSKTDIAAILSAANENKLTVIPLVQTFGHLEFLLKHEQFADLREVSRYPQSICPTNPRSTTVLHAMLDQVVALHKNLDAFHLGADEAFQVAQDAPCMKALAEKHDNSKMNLMLEHVSSLARYLRQKHKIKRVLVWNDMFQNADVQTLKQFQMGELVEPVIWGYAVDVQQPDYFPYGMMEQFAQVFPKLWIASAFKGANGPSQTFVENDRYLRNHQSWLRWLWDNSRWITPTRTAGIVITGWQRFDHFGSLCELFPSAIPSLVTALLYLNSGTADTSLYDKAGALLGCDTSGFRQVDRFEMYEQQNNGYRQDYSGESRFLSCQFPGVEIYTMVEKLKIYRNFFTSLENNPENQGWLSEFHLKHAYGQVYRAEQVYNQTEALRSELINLGSELRHQMNAIYYDDAVDEWLFSNVQLQLDRVKKLVNGCYNIVSSRSFPSRPLSKEELDF